jgi:hypothetical protein
MCSNETRQKFSNLPDRQKVRLDIDVNGLRSSWQPQRAVAVTSPAIEREDAPTFARAAQLLERNGALDFLPTKDDAFAAAVTWYQSERETSPDVLLVASDRDTVRYLNEELLRRREGRGF